MPHVVAAPDKYRGSASARQVAAAVARAAAGAGWTCDEAPVSDGGEGFLDVFEGRRHHLRVRGPLGEPVDAEWLLLDDGRTAVVEMALASGLALLPDPGANDPLAATTAGTGQLVADAVKAGARRVIVGCGGSATTDGGVGALAALEPHSRLRGVEMVVACDVDTVLVDAAAAFGPQKGASPAQARLLTRRLERLAGLYGPDVAATPGSGAAGGLAGGLASIGATLTSGFEVVADVLDLAVRIEGADLVVTGEGYLDEASWRGKSVGGVVALAAAADVPVLVVVGDGDPDLATPVPWQGLVGRAGPERAWADTLALVGEITAERLAAAC